MNAQNLFGIQKQRRFDNICESVMLIAVRKLETKDELHFLIKGLSWTQSYQNSHRRVIIDKLDRRSVESDI